MCLVIHQDSFPWMKMQASRATVDMKSRQSFYERHQHFDLSAKTKIHYKWTWYVINIFMEMSSLTDVHYLKLCETYSNHACVSAHLMTLNCEGSCTPRHNYHVSSQSAWLGEPLGFMCQMITGKEIERRQWFQEWGWIENVRWWTDFLQEGKCNYCRRSRTEQRARGG